MKTHSITNLEPWMIKTPIIKRSSGFISRYFGLILIALVSTGSYGGLFSNGQHPLPVEQVFSVNLEQDDERIELVWSIAPDYYLYQDKLTFTTSSGQPLRINSLPPAKIKQDPIFGTTKVYYNQLHVSGAIPAGKTAVTSITVGYQGCWEGGVCYPPQTTHFNLTSINTNTSQPQDLKKNSSNLNWAKVSGTNAGWFTEQLQNSSTLSLLALFLIAGLALALTPCVLPMVPILSTIIVGLHPKPSPKKSLALSATYVLAMAATYSIAGVVAGLSGANVQIALQHPLVIGTIASLFVVFAGAMFGWVRVEMPLALQQTLNKASHNQKGGQYTGVAIMGALSALVVGPCVAAPLAGALLFIAQSGDPVLGGLALFTMGIGMGLPLLLVGTSAAKWIPQAGPWMHRVKVGFGFLMLGMALWMTDRVWPEYTLGLVGVLALVMALVLALHHLWQTPVTAFSSRILALTLAVVLGTYGVTTLIGQISAKGFATSSLQQPNNILVTKVLASTVPMLLQQAQQRQQPVMLDFYADWCISCKELDAFVFSDAAVQLALTDFKVIKVDVTANDQQALDLMQSLNLVGPPALVFYNAQGQLMQQDTIVGVPKIQHLISLLNRLSDN
ncbi:MAG: protein-disulfide reductase DsbD [Gammaproteobacteria bacterium]|nr:protein-disulfide reductase DsbD [Gammaproteobacteria bacterium]